MSHTLDDDLNIVANAPFDIELLDGDIAFISKLDDEPNDVGGLTANELKAEFDRAGLTIQSYLNEKLVPKIIEEEAVNEVRTAAENERVANENQRIANENERTAQEAAREAAEANRVSTTEGIVAQSGANAERAAASAVNAKASEEAAAESARRAEDSKAGARELVNDAEYFAKESKTYSEYAVQLAREAASSAASAATSAENAAASESAAKAAQEAAKESARQAAQSESEAKGVNANIQYVQEQTEAAAARAEQAVSSAATSESYANKAATNAKKSEDAAYISMTTAKNAATSATMAADNASVAQDAAIAAQIAAEKARDEAQASAGGGAQSNWLENDESSPAYVHNRPFGYYGQIREPIGGDYFVEFSSSGRQGIVMAASNFFPHEMFDYGTVYHFWFSGTNTGAEYEFDAVGMGDMVDDYHCVGNRSLYSGVYPDSGEDVFAYIKNGVFGLQIYIYAKMPAGTYNINLDSSREGEVKVDRHWLPNDIAYMDDVEYLINEAIGSAIGGSY